MRVLRDGNDRVERARTIDPAPNRQLRVVAKGCTAILGIRVAVDPAKASFGTVNPAPGLLLLQQGGLIASGAVAVASVDIRAHQLTAGESQPSVALVREGDHELLEDEGLFFGGVED